MSDAAAWLIQGVVHEILDGVVFDFWTGQFPAAQEMGVVLERVRSSLKQMHIPCTKLIGRVRARYQVFCIEVYNGGSIIARRSYDRPVFELPTFVGDMDDDSTLIDATNNLLRGFDD